MKRDTVEIRIIAAKPDRAGNEKFVAATMLAVKKARSNETFGQVLRTTNVTKKERLFMKLKTLPTAAVAALVITVLLAVSGTAYAAYRMWLRPETNIKSVGQKYGRDQVYIELKNCYSAGESVQVEINDDKGGNPAEAAAVLGAECEINTIQNWAISEFGVDIGNVMSPYTVTARADKRISVSSDAVGVREFDITDETALIVGGDPVGIDLFMEGDPVAIVTSKDGNKLLALVKLGYPAELYASTDINNTYHVRNECPGNPKSSCINLPSLDVLREGEGGANRGVSGEMYSIQGKLIDYTSSNFRLESTSGEVYTINLAKDEINVFNAGNPYGEIAIEAGDVLEVRYSQNTGNDPLVIQNSQYHSVQLLLQEYDKKSDSNLQKYRY